MNKITFKSEHYSPTTKVFINGVETENYTIKHNYVLNTYEVFSGIGIYKKCLDIFSTLKEAKEFLTILLGD